MTRQIFPSLKRISRRPNLERWHPSASDDHALLPGLLTECLFVGAVGVYVSETGRPNPSYDCSAKMAEQCAVLELVVDTNLCDPDVVLVPLGCDPMGRRLELCEEGDEELAYGVPPLSALSIKAK